MKRLFKVIVPLLAVGIMAGFAGCGNYDCLDTEYSFPSAYVKIGEEWKTVEVKEWADYDGEQIQLRLKDGTVLIVHSANCILFNGNLPE